MEIRLLTLTLVLCILTGMAAGCSGKKTPDTGSGSNLSGEVDNSEDTGSEDAGSMDESGESQTGNASGTASTNGNSKNTGGATSKNGSAATSSNAPPPANYDIETAPMPTRNLTNKTISYFYWGDLETNPKSWTSLMKKEFGVDIKVSKANFANYWDTLAMLIRSGKSPDIAEMPSWDFYPRPITKDLLQPLDDIINLNDGRWNETRDYIDSFRWKDKAYVVFNKTEAYSWFYYNEKTFKNTA